VPFVRNQSQLQLISIYHPSDFSRGKTLPRTCFSRDIRPSSASVCTSAVSSRVPPPHPSSSWRGFGSTWRASSTVRGTPLRESSAQGSA